MVAAAAAAAVAAWWFWPAHGGWPAAAAPRSNVLLITIDTLRADRLNAGAMPALSALAARGRVFTTAYAHAPLTLPSHASMLTGHLPPVHGVRGNGAFRLDAGQLTLAERLRQHNYRTAAFTGAFVLDSRFGFDQGFDRYDGVADERAFAADFGFAERRAPQVLDAASAWILDPAAPAGPWFAWVHVFDPHAPYDAPGEAPGYDGEVRFTDRAIGDFLQRLDRGGAIGGTIIIVTADHGESLGEHGETTHGLFAYDSTMRVPLVIAGPGLGAGTHQAPAAHIDLVPTVLDVLGLPADPALPGRPLRELAASGPDDRAIYLEAMDGWLTAAAAPLSAVVHRGWKLIDTPIAELYDLAADAGERRNVAEADAGRVRQMRSRLAALSSGGGDSSVAALSPDAEARLRSLGYASGAARPRPTAFTEADDPKRVLPVYERFLAILAAGGRDAAALREVIAARPAFHAARHAAASILIESGRPRDAIALLEAPAADTGPEARERLGAAYLAAGDPAKAASILESVVAAAPAAADAWNALGVARAQLGRADARGAFDEAVTLAPHAARIRFNRAVAMLEAGDRAAAGGELAELVRRSPDFADGWKLLATVQHESGDRPAAVSSWQRAAAIDPRDVDVWFNLATTLADLGRRDEARSAARRFLDTAPAAYARERALVAPLVK